MFWARLFVENLTETETDKEDCKHTQQSTADVQLDRRMSAMKTHKELFLHHKSKKSLHY